jgi:hypothetical protein
MDFAQLPGQSADVRIHLLVNGCVLPVAQLGPKFLLLRTPVDHPPCEGEMVMSIDREERRRGVFLPDGNQVGSRKTVIVSRAGKQSSQKNQCDANPTGAAETA